MKNTKYWVCGLNYYYEILKLQGKEKPRSESWGQILGPFRSLKEAKNKAVYLINMDINELKGNRLDIKKVSARD